MADNEGSTLGKAANNGFVLVLLALVGTAVLQQAPLLVEHPRNAHPKGVAAPPQDIGNARLWQDPFAPGGSKEVPIGILSGNLDEARSDVLRNALQSAGHGDPRGQLLVLAGVPGGPYTELAEQRRRTRLAVVEALMAEHYVPEDAEHLRIAGSVPFERFLLQSPAATAGTAGMPDDPFAPARVVTLLWFASGSLGDRPRGQVCDFIERVQFSVQTTVIGPSDSDTLSALVREYRPDTKSPPQNTVRDVAQRRTTGDALPCAGHPMAPPSGAPWPHFYTPFATADLAVPSLVAGAEPSGYAALDRAGITRIIASDRRLAEALRDELAIRGIHLDHPDEDDIPLVGRLDASVRALWPLKERDRGETGMVNQSDDAVVLITEADTVYGRDLRSRLCTALLTSADPALATRTREPLPECLPPGPPARARGVYSFSYLRGLNGEIANSEAADADKGAGKPPADGANKESAGTNAPSAANPRSEGDAQTDYLARLAEQLVRLDARLRSDPLHPRALRAIGLLGSDVYDKLMFLRALKPRLPHALFFSTDPDARFLDVGERPWTRNLVLASTFGLRPGREDPTWIAPFRDSYQTASYATTRLALHAPRGPPATLDPCLAEVAQQVRIFEVGRTSMKAWRPEPVASSDSIGTCAERWSWLVPSERPSFAWLGSVQQGFPELARIAVVWVLLVGCTLLGRAALRRVSHNAGVPEMRRPHTTASAARRDRFTGIGLALLPVGLLLIFSWPFLLRLATDYGEGEALDIQLGMSVVPEMLLMAVALLVFLWVLAWRMDEVLERNLGTLHHDFGFSPDFGATLRSVQECSRRGPVWKRWLFDLLPPTTVMAVAAQDTPDDLPTPRFWLSYLRNGLRRARWARRGVILLACLLIWLLVLPPELAHNLPTRSPYLDLNHWYADLNEAAYLLLLALFVAVAEASLYCSSFLHALLACRPEWPEETLRQLRERSGISGTLALPWLRLRIAAQRSEVITPMIYYPFLFLAVLLFAHSGLFAPWDLPDSEVHLMVAIGLATVLCACVLRQAAEQVRSATIGELEQIIGRMRASSAAPDGRIALAQELLASARTLRTGAFAPFSDQPAVRSLLVPILSLASTLMVDLFSRLT